jgi:hypothetical protein
MTFLDFAALLERGHTPVEARWLMGRAAHLDLNGEAVLLDDEYETLALDLPRARPADGKSRDRSTAHP